MGVEINVEGTGVGLGEVIHFALSAGSSAYQAIFSRSIIKITSELACPRVMTGTSESNANSSFIIFFLLMLRFRLSNTAVLLHRELHRSDPEG